MTKPTNRWFSPFSARLSTKRPAAPGRVPEQIRPKVKRAPHKRVLVPRDPNWRVGDSEAPQAAAVEG
ncbi:hypothetical protein [Methylobacterium nonmethylotrophicum]|uniref:Uncharacterized protein n=1 Tax=Methylobacterium nonmethylotrophicum TaxID=1141884 RepID=A0A4Z0NEE9_9HYPH|nr:hypothetical protein [Methylobacterium nonmethylotrophicum]TGD93714.1 hypothetical protein EU555_33030 [Methylobacterium nonmethylotrophicum]